LLDLKNYETAMNNANPTMYNRSTCSAYLTVSAPVQLLSGTGAYKGITGTVTLHAENAALLPRTKNGACNGNGNPVRSYITISGSGTVKLG